MNLDIDQLSAIACEYLTTLPTSRSGGIEAECLRVIGDVRRCFRAESHDRRG